MTTERTILFVENKRVAHERSRREWGNATVELMGYMNTYKGEGHLEETVGLANIGHLTRIIQFGRGSHCENYQGYDDLHNGNMLHVVDDAARI